MVYHFFQRPDDPIPAEVLDGRRGHLIRVEVVPTGLPYRCPKNRELT